VRCSGLDQRYVASMNTRRDLPRLVESAPVSPPSGFLCPGQLRDRRKCFVCRWPYFGRRDNRRDPFRGSRRGPRKRRPLRRCRSRSIAAVDALGREGANSLEQSIAIDDRLSSDTAKSLLLVLTRVPITRAPSATRVARPSGHAPAPVHQKVSPALARTLAVRGRRDASASIVRSLKEPFEGFGNTLARRRKKTGGVGPDARINNDFISHGDWPAGTSSRHQSLRRHPCRPKPSDIGSLAWIGHHTCRCRACSRRGLVLGRANLDPV